MREPIRKIWSAPSRFRHNSRDALKFSANDVPITDVVLLDELIKKMKQTYRIVSGQSLSICACAPRFCAEKGGNISLGKVNQLATKTVSVFVLV